MLGWDVFARLITPQRRIVTQALTDHSRTAEPCMQGRRKRGAVAVIFSISGVLTVARPAPTYAPLALDQGE